VRLNTGDVWVSGTAVPIYVTSLYSAYDSVRALPRLVRTRMLFIPPRCSTVLYVLAISRRQMYTDRVAAFAALINTGLLGAVAAELGGFLK
jgi:hypothetical protein